MTSPTLKSGDIVGGTGQWCICQDLGTVPTSEHFGPLKTIGNSPEGEERTGFNCLMWLWIRHQFYLSKIVLLHLSGAVFPEDLQGCSACPLQARAVRQGGSLQAGNWEVKSWRKKGLRNYPLFGLADVGFFQDRTNASGFRVKNEELETPSGANRILLYG